MLAGDQAHIGPDRSGAGTDRVLEGAEFRHAMRHLAGAVSVVTTGRGEHRNGFTASSVVGLSVAPPTLLVCLNRDASSRASLMHSGSFCVNLLAHDQSHVAERFAGRTGASGVARYEGSAWQQLTTGALALSGALAAIDCELEEALDRHTHTIVIGRVQAVRLREAAEPLLYWHGAYRLISGIDQVLTRA